MMNRKEFFEYVADNVKEYLPPEYDSAKITVSEVVKNNDTLLHGITIQKEGEVVTPTIYMDGLYEAYQNGKEADSCVGDVADIRINNENPEMERLVANVREYDKVKDKLQIRICDPEMNQERLQGNVYTMHGDFAATYHVNISENPESTASFAVTNQMKDIWGVSVEQLHQDALAADKMREPVLFSMDEMMMNMMMGGPEPRNLLKDGNDLSAEDLMQPMFCLTNEHKMNGASVLLQNDIMEKIGEKVEGDYFILPSSIHETLVVPDNGVMSVQELSNMVKEVNETQVEPQERLSDKVQHYDSKEHILENAYAFEDRKLSREKERPKGIKEKLAGAKRDAKEKAAETVKKEKTKSAEMAM